MTGNERTVDMSCPSCGVKVDSRMQAGDLPEEVADGDVSVCFYCSGLGIYVGTPPMLLRGPTSDELVRLRADPGIRQMRNDLAAFWALERMRGSR